MSVEHYCGGVTSRGCKTSAAATRRNDGEKTDRTQSRRGRRARAEGCERAASRDAARAKRGPGDAPHGSHFLNGLLPVLGASAPPREAVRDTRKTRIKQA